MRQQFLKYTPDELRVILEEIGCEVVEEYALSACPESIHWHIKKKGERRGKFEATWMPYGEAWICYHTNRPQEWVYEVLGILA
ncbi:MAG: hypothetical protein JST12_12705 [Armatimonadetes bacterium]|nr:hypothetical protein [Armatimonadota bacterium]MBS1702518.1 hypothetical protein [Armatimonadota bacterium]MBS1725945.1 hypothetical protein [Armatimonadota bacterium]